MQRGAMLSREKSSRRFSSKENRAENPSINPDTRLSKYLIIDEAELEKFQSTAH